MTAIAITLAAAAFLLSATAGLGGSILLVPAMSLMLGPKEGIALSTLLLTCHNVAKLVVYRRSVPLALVAGVLALTVCGAMVGAVLLRAAPERWVGAAVFVSIAATFAVERLGGTEANRSLALPLSAAAGALSGFSGTSGPLKGVALRSFGLDRLHFVGAASVVSLAGDLAKTAIYLGGAPLLTDASWRVFAYALPLMPLAALAGRCLNRRVGEQGYAALFWGVMVLYAVRLVR